MEGTGVDINLGEANLWAGGADNGEKCGCDLVTSDDVCLPLDVY